MRHSSTNNNYSNNHHNRSSNEDLGNKRTSPRFLNTSADFNFLLNSENGMTSEISNDAPNSSKNDQNQNNCFTTMNDSNYAVEANFDIQNHLQKLDFLYHNLEGRVQKLENYVADKLLSSNMTISSSRNQGISVPPVFSMAEFSNPSLNASCSSSSSTVVSILETFPKEISVI